MRRRCVCCVCCVVMFSLSESTVCSAALPPHFPVTVLLRRPHSHSLPHLAMTESHCYDIHEHIHTRNRLSLFPNCACCALFLCRVMHALLLDSLLRLTCCMRMFRRCLPLLLRFVVAHHQAGNYEQKDIGQPFADVVLETGDLLYFPRCAFFFFCCCCCVCVCE